MSRRQWLCNLGRLLLLRWRVWRGHHLPRFAMALLMSLDRWAVQLHRERER